MFFNKKNKIFCLSTQRTGTTSVGAFFKHFGYNVADWSISSKNKWSLDWDNGNFEAIFNSKEFKDNQVFEDDPWWLPEFYKVLFHRFPGSKFILLTRDSEAWFNSMLSHSKGKTLGNTKRHCKVYRREQDFYNLFNNDRDVLNYDDKKIDNLLPLEGYRDHYINLYELRNKEIVDFFNRNSPESLFHVRLEDEEKWDKLGEFMKIDIPQGFTMHANKSVKK